MGSNLPHMPVYASMLGKGSLTSPFYGTPDRAGGLINRVNAEFSTRLGFHGADIPPDNRGVGEMHLVNMIVTAPGLYLQLYTRPPDVTRIKNLRASFPTMSADDLLDIATQDILGVLKGHIKKLLDTPRAIDSAEAQRNISLVLNGINEWVGGVVLLLESDPEPETQHDPLISQRNGSQDEAVTHSSITETGQYDSLVSKEFGSQVVKTKLPKVAEEEHHNTSVSMHTVSGGDTMTQWSTNWLHTLPLFVPGHHDTSQSYNECLKRVQEIQQPLTSADMTYLKSVQVYIHKFRTVP